MRLTLRRPSCKAMDCVLAIGTGKGRMITKLLGPVVLLVALVVGDQIRIHRPDHKYRLTIEVDTPDGVRSAAGVISVHPNRSYGHGGSNRVRGDAVLVDLGRGRNVVALLAHADKTVDLEDINFVALRAFNAAGQKAMFRQMSRLTGSVPVKAGLMPVLATFADSGDPTTMRVVRPDDFEGALGKDIRLRGMTVEIVPNGLWPIDFGGALGEPVTRGIVAKMPWINQVGQPARALQAAGLPVAAGLDAREAFTRD